MTTIREQLAEISSNGDFLEIVHKSSIESRDDRGLVGKELAALHNEGVVDAVAEFQNLRQSSQGHNFFSIRFIFEEALPLLNAPVLEVMNCVKHLTLEAGNDGAAGTIISAFITYCEANSNRPDEVLALAKTNIGENFDFISPAIIAGSKLQVSTFVKKAINLTIHEDIAVRTNAVFSLGRINYTNNLALVDSALEALEEAVHAEHQDSLFSVTLKSGFSLYVADKSKEAKVAKLIGYILSRREKLVLHTASELFGLHKANLSESITTLLLDALLDTNPKNKGTLNYIDYGLDYMLKNGMADKAINFIERLLIKNAGDISVSQFSCFTRELLSNKGHQLDKLITRWLLSKSVRLGRASFDLISKCLDKDILLTADINQLQNAQQGTHFFLAKKACGWLFLKPVSAASFVVSLLDSATDEEIDHINKIIFNPLLISYSGSVKDYLNKISLKSSDKVQKVITQLLSELNSYHEGLHSIRDITELTPTAAQREAYHRMFSRQMTDSFKKAPKGLLSELFGKPSVLLYGNSSIHYIHHGSNNEKTRQEVPLQRIGHSVEFPSLEYLDPHGLDNRLRVFKLEGCSS